MKVLVLASESISGADLRDAIGTATADDADVLVVAPAFHQSALRFWLSDADAAIAEAERVQLASVEQLNEDGISASGDTGESEPLDALADTLRTFPAERIVVFSHGKADRAYRERVSIAEIEQRFGLPTTEHLIEA